jgi:hypothetical protein
MRYDKARAKAYRLGEDGIAGLCDRYQLLCFAPAFWNERDPHLKERLFGVTPYEGNHGEDVKEYYFHVDNTPTQRLFGSDRSAKNRIMICGGVFLWVGGRPGAVDNVNSDVSVVTCL